MLSDADRQRVREFSRAVEQSLVDAFQLDRALGRLHADAVRLGDLLQGPAEDSPATVADAQHQLAEVRGTLKRLEVAMGDLLSAQELRPKVEALGWRFEGWTSDAGWTAFRYWEPGGACEAVTDRRADGLLYKLERRNAEEAHHAG